MDSFLLLCILLACHLLTAQQTRNLVGYECGHQEGGYRVYSLVDIGNCDIPDKPDVETSQIRAAVLQRNEYTHTHAFSCRVEIYRRIEGCYDGLFSNHAKPIANADVKYVTELSRHVCQGAHYSKTLNLFSRHIIPDLVPNTTRQTPMILAGSLHGTGSCLTGEYRDPFGVFENVIVQGYVQVTLQDYDVAVQLGSNNVILPSGVRCELNSEHCIDIDGSTVYWHTVPITACGENQFSILYEGLVNKTVEKGGENKPLYSVESRDALFAFTEQGTIDTCHHKFITTEHPKIFIIELLEGEKLEFKTDIATEDIDLMTYVNSKLIYVEKHIKRQIEKLYHDVMWHKCELERKVLANTLSIGHTRPDEFAYQLLGRPGYIGVLGGEVIYIAKCVPVTITERTTTECFNELPVTRNGKPMFLTAKSRILTDIGLKIPCDPSFPILFKIDGTWKRRGPYGEEAKTPEILKPSGIGKFKYSDPAYIATGGIYDQKKLDRRRDRTLFEVKKGTILNAIALGVLGYNVTELINLPLFVDNLFENLWQRAWGNFVIFGTASAGIIGIFFIGKIIKFLCDTAIHGLSLYHIFGCSWLILGAIWDSLTQFLIHWGNARERHQGNEGKERDTEMETISLHRTDDPSVPDNSADVTDTTITATCPSPSLQFAGMYPVLPSHGNIYTRRLYDNYTDSTSPDPTTA